MMKCVFGREIDGLITSDDMMEGVKNGLNRRNVWTSSFIGLSYISRWLPLSQSSVCNAVRLAELLADLHGPYYDFNGPDYDGPDSDGPGFDGPDFDGPD